MRAGGSNRCQCQRHRPHHALRLRPLFCGAGVALPSAPPQTVAVARPAVGPPAARSREVRRAWCRPTQQHRRTHTDHLFHDHCGGAAADAYPPNKYKHWRHHGAPSLLCESSLRPTKTKRRKHSKKRRGMTKMSSRKMKSRSCRVSNKKKRKKSCRLLGTRLSSRTKKPYDPFCWASHLSLGDPQ